MILLPQFKNYLRKTVDESPHIKDLFVVATEPEISSMLQDITPQQLPFLMALIPVADTKQSLQDNVRYNHNTVLYLLTKSDNSKATSLSLIEQLQPHIVALQERLIEDSGQCTILKNLDLTSFDIQAEYKLFSKLTGWSMAFSF